MCYCGKQKTCMKRGLGNITPCYYSKIIIIVDTYIIKRFFQRLYYNHLDIPASVSLPHFYNADPSLLDEVEGLNPVKEKHESIIVMQPVNFHSTNGLVQ